MRLIRMRTRVVPHLTLMWEVAHLAEQEVHWVPFARIGETQPIGEIHATTHEVRLYAGTTIFDRQAVTLCVGEHSSCPPKEESEHPQSRD